MENASPHGGTKAAELAFLDKLTKAKAGEAQAQARIRAGLARQGVDWEVTWHALKAAKKVGCAASCADLLVDLLDAVHLVPSAKMTYFERALQTVIEAAGAAMAPHVNAILSRTLTPVKEFDPNDSDQEAADAEFERTLHTSSAARSALSSLAGLITREQADEVFGKLDDSSADVRAAALDVATSAMKRFAEPIIPKILECSRDTDEILRVKAVDGLERCIGYGWEFKKTGSYGQGIAKTRDDHDACKARLLEMRSDASEDVRDAVKDAFTMLGCSGDALPDSSMPAKKAKRAGTKDE